MLGSSPSALGRKNEGEVLTMPPASGGLPGVSQTRLLKVCAVTQSMYVCRESHTAWVCLHCVWVLPGETLAREELARAWVWGLCWRKPDLIE